MRINHKALESYGAVKVVTGVSGANSVQLIQMLFDGLLESLSTAKGHITHKDIAEKSKPCPAPVGSFWASKMHWISKKGVS